MAWRRGPSRPETKVFKEVIEMNEKSMEGELNVANISYDNLRSCFIAFNMIIEE